MFEDTPTDPLERWQHGWFKCRVDSATTRIKRELQFKYVEEEHTEDIHAQIVIEPEYLTRTPEFVEKIEERLLFQLAEHGLKESLWPISPVILWQRWDARIGMWVRVPRP